MLWLKCCPRCGGDLYLERDVYGAYVACLQCGRHFDIKEANASVATKAA